jgi:hypothetical protein
MDFSETKFAVVNEKYNENSKKPSEMVFCSGFFQPSRQLEISQSKFHPKF